MLSRTTAGICFATVGVHPCASQLFDKHPDGPKSVLSELKKLALHARDSGRAVAFGEIGLDYDRLFLAPKDTQLKYFESQLDLATELEMPLFLHSRACSEDFERLLKPRLENLPKRGLVHSFTGTVGEMQRLVAMGFDIGINGCSMKTDENISVVREVPLESLQIETDGPWVRQCSLHRRD
jgi:TatD DNase family protein